MDAERFDTIVRNLSTDAPRRTVLKAAAAAAVGGVLTVFGHGQARARQFPHPLRYARGHVHC